MLKVSVNVQKWIDYDSLEQVAVDEVKAYVREIYNGAVNRSPVYSGSYRASWRIGFGAPDESTTTGGSPLAPLPRPPFYWPKGYVMGDTVYISNNQPYAMRIERGWSDFAPHGVLAVAVASARMKMA